MLPLPLYRLDDIISSFYFRATDVWSIPLTGVLSTRATAKAGKDGNLLEPL